MNNNVEIKNYGIYEKINNNKSLQVHAKTPLNKILISIFICLLVFFAFLNIPTSFASNGGSTFWENLKRFFSPIAKSNFYGGENLWKISFDFLFYSIKIAFLGTILGSILAFVTAYFGNKLFNSKYVYIPIKMLTILLRILPEIIFIYMFRMSFDKNLGMMLTIMWFSWIWLHEYFTRTIESIELNTYFHFLKITKSKWNAFCVEIWPQIKYKVFDYIFYSMETNMRWGSLLNKFGFIGIGSLLNLSTLNTQYLNELMIPLFVFVLFLITLDLLKWAYFKFIGNHSKYTNSKQYKNKKITKYVFTISVFLVVLTICILSIVLISNDKVYSVQTNRFFYDLFNPNWSILQNNSWNDFKSVMELISLTIVTFFIVYLIVYLKLFFENDKLYGNKKTLITKMFDTLFRNIPIVVYFLFWSPWFNHPQTAFICAFAIHSICLVTKQMQASMQKVSESQIILLRVQGYSKFWIYRNYIWPLLKENRTKIMSFQFEIIFRNFAIYGIFSSSTFGQKLIYNRFNEFYNTTPYLWILILMLALVNLGVYFWQNKNSFFSSYFLFSRKLVLQSS